MYIKKPMSRKIQNKTSEKKEHQIGHMLFTLHIEQLMDSPKQRRPIKTSTITSLI